MINRDLSREEQVFGIGKYALASSHETHWVGPLVVDKMGRTLVSGPFLWV